MTTPSLLVLLIAAGALDAAPPSAPAPPADPAAAASAAPAIVPLPPAPPPPGGAIPGDVPDAVVEGPPDHHGWRHAVGFGAHSTTFFSKEGSQYTFHSASLGYVASVGARGPFLHAFALLPLQARQDGHVYATSDFYRRRDGGDLLLGWQWRWLVRCVEAEAGPGLHGTFLYLPGKPGYRDFSAFPLGLGAGTVLRWETRARRFSRPVTVGTYASIAYDFRDPLHANDLAHGFTFRAGVALGLGARR
jgi:hypothetical protein